MLTLLCAVFSTTWGEDTVVTFTPGTDTGSTSVTKNGVTATMSTMDGDNYYQIYKSASAIFTCQEGNITKIEITCTKENSEKYGPGCASLPSTQGGSYTYSGYKGTWTGSAQSVTIVASSNQVRITELVVTYNNTSYIVNYDCNGSTDCPDQAVVVENAPYTLANAPTKEGCFFIGWSDGTTTYNAGASYTVTQDVTFTAQWSKGTETWAETTLANLTESDVFVFVGKKSNESNYYAMTNNPNNTYPAAASVNITVNDNSVSITVTNTNYNIQDLKWNIENTTDGYIFYPDGDKTKYLYSQASNSTNIRVGSGNNNKYFKLDAESGYLQNTKTNRYLGLYNGSDWRGYASATHTNIKDEEFAFYKRVINLAEIPLDEGKNNTTTISDNNETRVNVKLTRSLDKDMWNAICLPFAMDDAQRKALFGEGYILQEMSSAELDANGTAQLNFTIVDANTSTVAGTPYLVKPTQDVTSEVINDVKIVKATDGKPAPVESNGYKFQGIYSPTALEDMGADPENILFLGRGSQLLTPSTDSKPMKGFRAYFILNSSNGASGLSLTTEDGGIINSISLAEVDGLYTNMDNNRVYSISGQYIGTKTEGLAKGIYIVNGRKFIVK